LWRSDRLCRSCKKRHGVPQEFILNDYAEFRRQPLLFFQEPLFCKFFLAADVLDAEIGEDTPGTKIASTNRAINFVLCLPASPVMVLGWAPLD